MEHINFPLLLGADELQKGQAGDWKKEGYTISHTSLPDEHTQRGTKGIRVLAHDKNGKQVGYADIATGKSNSTSLKTDVDIAHRRKGIAIGMYQYAEKVTNTKMVPSKDRTNDGKALWRHGQKQWGNTNFGKSEQLEKGQAGDWKKEGYKVSIDHNETFTHHNGMDEYTVKAHSPSGEQAGMYTFWHKGPDLKVDISDTKPSHQRKGLASEAYRLIQNHLGVKLNPGSIQTHDAEKLWAQPNRPFGKSSLQKGQAGDWQKDKKYKVKHIESIGTYHRFGAFHGKNLIGELAVESDYLNDKGKPALFVEGMAIDKEHRRKGLGTSLYQLAEKHLKKPISDEDYKSKDAKKFWAQPNRPFGKADLIPGGLAQGKTNKDFPAKKIKQGEKVEMEHTSNKRIADEIARDHLTENPNYYNDLARMEKGLKGDWQKEGYTFTHDQDGKGWHTVSARTPKGEVAGIFNFTDNKKLGTLKPQWANVGEEHQRKGLASEAYRLVQKNTGFKLLPSDIQTEAGKQLWSKNHSLAKSQKEDMSQVASVAVMHGGKILMGRRIDNGLLTLPGGHMDKGETPEAGALRELFEEAGVKPDDIHYLGNETITTKKGEKKKIHAFVCFGKYKTSVENDPDEEVSKWQWIDCSSGSLPKHIRENLHSPKNVVLKKLGLLKD